MTTTEHLLTIAAEECSEVAQRISKALRFGLTEIQPGQPHTNAERIVLEWMDLHAAIMMLEMAGAIKLPSNEEACELIADKSVKVHKFLAFSYEQGTLRDAPTNR